MLIVLTPLHINTQNVSSTAAMFRGAKAFNQTFSNFDGGMVQNMDFMFSDSNFTQDASSWNVTATISCSAFCRRCMLPRFLFLLRQK